MNQSYQKKVNKYEKENVGQTKKKLEGHKRRVTELFKLIKEFLTKKNEFVKEAFVIA